MEKSKLVIFYKYILLIYLYELIIIMTYSFSQVLDLKKAGKDSFEALQESVSRENTADIFINLHDKGFLTLTSAELEECNKEFYGEQAERCFKFLISLMNKNLNDLKKTKPEFKVMQAFIAEFEYARNWIGECGGWVAFYKEDKEEMQKGIIEHCFLISSQSKQLLLSNFL